MNSANQGRADTEYAYAEESGRSDLMHKVHNALIGRYPYAIVLAVLGLSIGGYLGWNSVTPVFESDATYQISAYTEVTAVTDQREVIKDIENYISGQRLVIRSDNVIKEAMNSEEWVKNGIDMSIVEFKASLNTGYSPKRNTNEIFYASFRNEDKNVAVAGMRAVSYAYEKAYEEQQLGEISDEIRRLADNIADYERDIDLFSQKIRVETGQLGIDTIERRKGALDTQLIALRFELRDLVELLGRSVDAGDAEQPGISDIDSLMPYLPQLEGQIPELASVGANIRAAEFEMQRLEADGAGERHPEVRKWQNTLSVLKRRQREILSQIDPNLIPLVPGEKPMSREELMAKKSETESRIKYLENEISSLIKQIDVARDHESRRNRAAQKLKYAQEKYEQALDKRDEQDRLDINDYASVPSSPANDDARLQMTLLGGFGGGGMGFGVILIWGFLDRKLRDSSDARSTMGGAELLGVLPTLPNDLADPDKAGTAAHCVHHIRTLLQVGPDNEERRVFTVTSPASGTGKTSLVMALGLSFAESGERTLIIDFDLFGAQLSARIDGIRRQRIGHVLKKRGKITEDQIEKAAGHADENNCMIGEAMVALGFVEEGDLDHALDIQADTKLGLMDVIAGGQSVANCAAETGFKNLSILPVGNAHPHDAGKLSPNAVRRLLNEAKEHFDVILADTGPVPASLEASVVAVHANGVILTVSRGEQRPLATKAKQHLESIGARVAGVVFNRAEAKDIGPYSYRPSSMSHGEGRSDCLAVDPRRVAEAKAARFGPVANAVSLYSPGEESDSSSNGNGAYRNGGTNGASNGASQHSGHVDEERGGFVIDD